MNISILTHGNGQSLDFRFIEVNRRHFQHGLKSPFFNGEEYKEMASGCQLKIGKGSGFKG
jgi:hypothetical protein